MPSRQDGVRCSLKEPSAGLSSSEEEDDDEGGEDEGGGAFLLQP